MWESYLSGKVEVNIHQPGTQSDAIWSKRHMPPETFTEGLDISARRLRDLDTHWKQMVFGRKWIPSNGFSWPTMARPTFFCFRSANDTDIMKFIVWHIATFLTNIETLWHYVAIS